MQVNKSLRIAVIVGALLALAAVYLFQLYNYLGFFSGILGIDHRYHPNTVFIFNKTFRLILNDTACFALIWAIFREKKYLRTAFFVFLFEVIVLLPLYFSIKLSLEGDSEISSPLLSQIHRMIINPTLMLLLMVGFFYQRMKKK